MDTSDNGPRDGTERRSGKDRRIGTNRRSNLERRLDPRDGKIRIKKNLIARLRTLTNSRLGVDRRRGTERRLFEERRNDIPRSMLTKEELAELLK